MNEIEVDGISGIGKKTKARAITIKNTAIGDIAFPHRALTPTDLNHANSVIAVSKTLTIPFISQIYGINRDYSKVKLDAIAKGKSKFEQEMEAIIERANRKDKVFKFLIPNIDQKIPITDAHDDQLIMLQAGLNEIDIFDSSHMGVQELETRIRRDVKLIKEFDGEKVIAVRINTKQRSVMLEKKLKLIYGTEEIGKISTPYMNPDYAYDKLTLFRNYANKPKWVHMSGIPKRATDGKTSMAHVLAMFGIDSISLRTHKPFEPDHILNVNRSNWRTGAYLDFPNEHRQRYNESLDCMVDCPPDHDKKVEDIMNEYSPEERLSEVRVHEAYETQYGFWETRMKILGEHGELFKLYKSREFLRRYFEGLEGIDFKARPMV